MACITPVSSLKQIIEKKIAEGGSKELQRQAVERLPAKVTLRIFSNLKAALELSLEERLEYVKKLKGVVVTDGSLMRDIHRNLNIHFLYRQAIKKGDGEAVEVCETFGANKAIKKMVSKESPLGPYTSAVIMREMNTCRSWTLKKLLKEGISPGHCHFESLVDSFEKLSPAERDYDSITLKIKSLVEAGLDINGVFNQGDWEGAVIQVAGRCRPCDIDLLLNNGASINILGEYSPLCDAIVNDKTENALKLIHSGAFVNGKYGEYDDVPGAEYPPVGFTPIMFAASRAVAVVDALIKAGADVNVQSKYGETALMLAAKTGSLENVRKLLAAGAIVDLKDQHRKTALMYAAKKIHLEVVQVLLEAGANGDLQSINGNTALIHAAAALNLDLVRILLARAVRVNVQDYSRGVTALSYAAGQGGLEVVQLLVEAGAIVEIRDIDGRTALDCALGYGRLRVARYLSEARVLQYRAARTIATVEAADDDDDVSGGEEPAKRQRAH